METPGVIIVGAGLTGATAALTLREEGFTGSVTLVGAEPHLPYLRPPLSKGFLAGSEDEASLAVAPPGGYADAGIDVVLDQRVLTVDTVLRRATLSDGRSLAYADLLLATGASPRTLTLPGATLDGVLTLRSLDDAKRMRGAITGSGDPSTVRLVIVGAGWIGMEVAATARALGAAVTVVAPDAIPLAAALGPQIGTLFAERHARAGVGFRLDSRPRELIGQGGRVSGVRLATGEALPADLVLIAVGATPNVELAASSGIATDNGILVDQFLRTSTAHVYAAGDAASVYDPALGGHQRNEHWANAIASGEAAARSILGTGSGLTAIPYFYTDQFDIGMEYSGYPSLARDAQLIFRGEPGAGAYVAFWAVPEHDGRLIVVAGMSVNTWDVQDEIRELISSRRPVAPVELTRAPLPAAS
ncbi:MAG: FAD-dependent oxidoreductase [Naasia sp.]|uniref:NAD(P)/FAD-dependent oxidoreductase n=1 Tax=Naasia sp. TaxID=2546198 RepID=UPI00263531BD|nr:FAD-dependent oxidoreductase [Naasia sp.]MCU1570241.1 FAD-dependent oxidoreductase [Naasia sp.]